MKTEGRRQKAEGRASQWFDSLAVYSRVFSLQPSAFSLAKRGMTLAELLISMTILSMMSVVLAGMSNAVNSAWSYTKGIEDSDLQARAAFERIEYMVSQTGTYKITGQPTRLGLAVINRPVEAHQLPDVLVLWTGGRSGGMAASGLQSRLPIVGELLIYTWNSSTPSQLVEVAFPGQTDAFDFAASDLVTQVTNLLASTSAEVVPICERLRVSSMSASSSSTSVTYPTGPSSPYGPSLPETPPSTPSSSSGASSVGNLRFTLTLTPSDTDLASATPQTTAWTQLNWPQGTFGSRSGIRQANLQIELQVEPDGIVRASDTVTAIPFFGSASRRYVYEP